jgi:hypothetical protein
VSAISNIGTPSSSAKTSTNVVPAADGVLQSTVSGSGDVEASTGDDHSYSSPRIFVGKRVQSPMEMKLNGADL